MTRIKGSMLPHVKAALEALQATPTLSNVELLARFDVILGTAKRLRQKLGIPEWIRAPREIGFATRTVMDHPEMSDVALAAICGVTPQRIGQIRQKYCPNERR